MIIAQFGLFAINPHRVRKIYGRHAHAGETARHEWAIVKAAVEKQKQEDVSKSRRKNAQGEEEMEKSTHQTSVPR
jgi:hypothetical protein